MQEESGDKSFISLKEAIEILEITENEIEHLVAQGTLSAYKLGDQVLRFRRDQIGNLKAKWRINREELFEAPVQPVVQPQLMTRASWLDRAADFFYFNDFYIFCAVLIAGLIYLIFASQ